MRIIPRKFRYYYVYEKADYSEKISLLLCVWLKRLIIPRKCPYYSVYEKADYSKKISLFRFMYSQKS